MAEELTDLAMQTRQKLIALLALLEKDKASLSPANPDIFRSGSEIYSKLIDHVRRGLENLDNKNDETSL